MSTIRHQLRIWNAKILQKRVYVSKPTVHFVALQVFENVFENLSIIRRPPCDIVGPPAPANLKVWPDPVNACNNFLSWTATSVAGY